MCAQSEGKGKCLTDILFIYFPNPNDAKWYTALFCIPVRKDVVI